MDPYGRSGRPRAKRFYRLPNRNRLSPASMRSEIHQYYGTFGFSLAIVTEKTYNAF
ncbi:hypothetical protein RHECNPAF_439006 [Rhizobium etli CNPAF512]|nr:hypothetical protein RHECNPAF_439006 [Rhizobium etli CNPAF512]